MIKYNELLKYNDICKMMEDVPSNNGSKGRSIQLSKWKQYYDIEKNGIYYIIKKKYSEDEIELIEHSGKYTSYITDKLIGYLNNIDNNEITLSYYDIYEITSMVNKRYHQGKNNMHSEDYKIKLKEICKFDGVKDEMSGITAEQSIRYGLSNFFETSNKLLKQNVDNALKSMYDKGLIVYSDSFVLYKKPVRVDDYYVIEQPHICNEKEISEMIDIRKEALETIGLKKRKELFFASNEDKKKYHKYILDKVKEKFGYDYYGNAVHIILGKRALEIELKFIKSQKINKNIQEQIIKSKEIGKKITKYLCEQFVDEYVKM